MIYGLNVDPSWSGGRPSAELLQRLGVDMVRLTSRDSDAVRDYIRMLHVYTIRTLAIITDESHGHLVDGADVYQIGNEPDLNSPSSETLTPDQYVERWRIYRETFPDVPMIAAGLASGQVSYWQNVGPRLVGQVNAVAVHPYAKTAAQAQTLLRAYKAVRPELALWVTEWFRDPNQVAPFQHMLRAEADAGFWFCATDGMVDGMGLMTADFRLKPHGQQWLVSR